MNSHEKVMNSDILNIVATLSTVLLLDTETPGSTGHRNFGDRREIYNEDADDGTRTCNPSALAI